MLPDNFWKRVITESNGMYSRWNPALGPDITGHCESDTPVIRKATNVIRRDYESILDQELRTSQLESDAII